MCAFVPQTGLFVPLAAFFVAFCLLLCLSDAARRPAVCLLLGAAAGMAAVRSTNVRLERTRVQYAGRAVVLTAEVEKVSDSYYSGIVDAVLRVETVNGRDASFRVECETLRPCEAGQRVSGRFVLSAPEQNDKIERYADGIALLAQPDEEKPAFEILGESGSYERLRKKTDGVRILSEDGSNLRCLGLEFKSYIILSESCGGEHIAECVFRSSSLSRKIYGLSL